MVSIKSKILDYLKSKEKVEREELVKKVAEEVNTQERIVKAVLTKMIKRGEIVEEDGYIKLA